ncbi:MAG: glycosyltransferase family 9 protein [Vicinamibacterales bacterium]
MRFFTDLPSLVEGLPYIDEVLPWSARPESDFTALEYENAKPFSVHCSKILGDLLGLNVVDVRPDIVFDGDVAASFVHSFERHPRPRIVIQRDPGFYTPNKRWPDEYWHSLVESLVVQATVIEIGSEAVGLPMVFENYLDLRAHTSLAELAALLSWSDVFVGPVSGPSHLAAAVGTPSVIIIGGFEGPFVAAYDDSVRLHSAVSCAPCWKTEPCPFDLKCLRMISPEEVAAEVWAILQPDLTPEGDSVRNAVTSPNAASPSTT